MLNISNKSIHDKVSLEDFASVKCISNKRYYRELNRLSILFFIILIILLFLPWTQNITGKGYVTTLKPNQRPQTIQSPIPGRIEKWHVKEGDYVQKGDTVLRISEIKSEYFDKKLVERTGSQLEVKNQSIHAYEQKVKALGNQVSALESQQKLKFEQTKNKVKQAELKVISENIALEAAKTNKSIAETQYNRVLKLEAEGLKAKKDVESKKLKLQATEAKLIYQENKLLESKNKVLNAKIELSNVNAFYRDKIAKSKSDLYTAKSLQFNAQAEVSKLESAYSNYARRRTLEFVTAPQDGFINKVLKGGVGITFKAGESLVKVMPKNYDLAVETYVRPIDLPLVHLGEKVRVQFDGWPAIVFSGWQSISYGTYGAKVVAIENFISDNGMYRILLAPDESDHQWPEGVRVGSGAKTIALLNDVPIWYELWRQLNGFPPNFYKPSASDKTSKKK